MMMKKTIVLAMIFLFGAAAATAQTETSTSMPSVFNDYLNVHSGGSLFHVPGLSFYSSAGFSFFSGPGSESFGMGYYMGHFGLSLSNSVSLHWDVGVGSVMNGATEYNQPAFFIPNLDLTYRPSESLMLRLEFHQYRYPGYYGMLGR
ncbi:MAG: hypothetical protein PHD74_02310 [Candidatus Krumholzibacteria bacterium]|nr:hypothetical protein [Candidatus Krumholzibacteria bacterium]